MKCNICDKDFKSFRALNGHKRVHYIEGYLNSEEERLEQRLSRKREINQVCKVHGLSRFTLKTDGYYRCNKCSVTNVHNRRKAIKMKLVSTFGGKCQGCGYAGCIEAFDFHHVEENKKDFGIAAVLNIAFSKMLEEAKKCVLVCANCHREIHAGVRKCPDKLF